MKTRHLLFAGFAMAAMLTSCLSEPEFEPITEGAIPVNVDGSIDQVSTKVNAQGFEDNDALGLYVVNYENNNNTPGTLLDKGNQADHVKYIFDQANWKWNPVRPIYYKDVNTNVDIYAYYPYAEPSSVSEYNFEVQKDQSTARSANRLSGYEASDFLWGKTTNVVPSENKVSVRLSHKMAGVQVVLQEGTGFEAGEFELIGKKILLTGTTRKAKINLATGAVTPVGGAQASGIVMAPQTDGSFRAIAVPQEIAVGTVIFSITVDGISYGFSQDKKTVYESGKLSAFTIKINRKSHTGTYELELVSTEIVPWTEDLNTHEGEARQYYCVHCEEPGTLAALIAADEKNPKKIKNLKVSGVISDEDFYFMRDEMTILEAVNLKEARVVDVKVTATSVPGHKDDYGNSTVFAKREAGTYNDIIPDDAFKNKSSLCYFTFPEKVLQIGVSAFESTSVSGSLVIPDDVQYIWNSAFRYTDISSLVFASGVEVIGPSAFGACSSLSGNLSLPEVLTYIGSSAFASCCFTGNLILPHSLEYIGESAFNESGEFVGNLTIPEKIKILYANTFWCNYKRSFTGKLDLANVQSIGTQCFYNCGFTGELVFAEGLTSISTQAFYGGKLTSVVLPNSIKSIEKEAFRGQGRLMNVNFPEGLITIKERAFMGCSQLQSLDLPSTLTAIGLAAFENCNGIFSIISRGVEPPTVQNEAFNGVGKDNFTLEVPASAVNAYATDAMWGQFRRISAHHDFSISRNLARALNAETSKTYVLRAPSGQSWSVEDKPEWIEVTPSSGTGKAEVTITFNEMSPADAQNISVTMTHPTYAYLTISKSLKGRKGEIVFSLEGKDYTTKMDVEQFDYAYGEGEVIPLNEATKGNGVDIVFLGDCYDAADIAAGNYLADINEAMGYYFDIEPYKTYKEYFNVYTVLGVSDDSGIGTLNTIKDSKFGSSFGEKNLVQPDVNVCFEYARKAKTGLDVSKTLIVLVQNTTEYGGICYMWGDGSAIACCPKSADAYPYDFRGIVQHEAGGHGFGKLADEYIYHNAFISTCTCIDGCGHVDDFNKGKANGWYANLELTGDMNEVGWSHLIFHPKYSDQVDIYEGGYFHTRGVYRSEPVSCMNNNIPYYSAISRQTMVEKIMKYAGEEFSLESFIAKDVTTAAPIAKSGVDFSMPTYNNGKQYAPVYMGESPEL